MNSYLYEFLYLKCKKYMNSYTEHPKLRMKIQLGCPRFLQLRFVNCTFANFPSFFLAPAIHKFANRKI